MIVFTIPGRAKSVANQRLHWAVKSKQTAADRKKAMTLCPKWEEGPLLIVTLFRFGVRELDTDNLAAALKGHRDGIASRLRIDDGSSLVQWEYRQLICSAGDERVDVMIWRSRPKNPETIDIGVGRPIYRDNTQLHVGPPRDGGINFETRSPTPAVYKPRKR